MKPRPVTDWDLEVFGPGADRVTYGPPRGGVIDAAPLELIRITRPGEAMLKIPFVADDRDTPPPEGTVWITVWGHQLPPLDGDVFATDPEDAPAAVEPSDGTVHVAVTIGEDDDLWAYECSPGDYAEDDSHVEGDVPAELIEQAKEAMASWHSAQRQIAEAVGIDPDDGLRLRERCMAWIGDVRPPHTYWGVTMPARPDEWPLRAHVLFHANTEAEAVDHIASLPETFYVHYGAHKPAPVTRSELYIETSGWKGSTSSCHRCGWTKEDHDA